jgi:hypothetical protein
MAKRLCYPGSPKKLVRMHSTEAVSDFIALDVLNFITPHNELAVDDFPCPVLPMKQETLKLLDIVLKWTH